MRYLTLSADYQEFSLRSADSPEPIEPGELGLPYGLVAELGAWNRRYQHVVQADAKQRKAEPMASVIRDLDRAGLELANRLAAAAAGGAKVQYFSEGLLRPLSP